MYARILENTEHKFKGCVAEHLLSWFDSLQIYLLTSLIQVANKNMFLQKSS